MKPSDLPYSGAANEQLRTQLAAAISRAELASKAGPSVAAAELLNQIGAAYDYLFSSGSVPQPPSPVDSDSIVITPTATSFVATWDPAEVPTGGYPVSNYFIQVYLGSATGGPSVLASGAIGDVNTWDSTDLLVPVELDPETTYNLRIQTTYFDPVLGIENSAGSVYKQFTTAAA